MTDTDSPTAVELARHIADQRMSTIQQAFRILGIRLTTEVVDVPPEPGTDAPLAVGDVLHGFCGGIFGRDHYECCRVETVGRDWVVVRADDAGLGFATSADSLLKLRQYRTENDYCPSQPCPVQPREA